MKDCASHTYLTAVLKPKEKSVQYFVIFVQNIQLKTDNIFKWFPYRPLPNQCILLSQSRIISMCHWLSITPFLLAIIKRKIKILMKISQKFQQEKESLYVSCLVWVYFFSFI